MKTVLAAAAAALCVVCVVATPQPRRETFRYWKKRMDSQPIVDQSTPNFQSPPEQYHGVNSQLVMRTPRGQRPYDIPQIGSLRNSNCSLITLNRFVHFFLKTFYEGWNFQTGFYEEGMEKSNQKLYFAEER
ncbi:hypothetical protein HUJ04_009883 [Dendroctonus ponderosae]|nr:hypothetical protein HUJ04_009883 [Dendroctonus ponderosae]